VLAKHDERYMPPEVVKALKQSGHWEETSGSGNGEPTPGAAAPVGGKP
jgi:cytochrome c-type biogenesis protein CcmE